MALSSQLKRRLRRAIGDAFSSYEELRIVIGEGDWPNLFNVQLEKIAKPDPQDIVIYNLIQWAEKKGHVRNLYHICLEANPTNPQLVALADAIRHLPEEETDADGDPNEVAIDDAVYRPPPQPFTREQKLLRTLAAVLAIGLGVEILCWATIFFDYTWLVVLGAFIPGSASIVWAMISDRPLRLRAVNFTNRLLIYRLTLPALVVAIIGFTVITLVFSRLKYTAPAGSPPVEIASKRLSPGELKWMVAVPWGRSISVEKVAAGYRGGTYSIYPWYMTKVPLEIIPYVVVEPDKSVLRQISVDDDDPARAWTLTIERNDKPVVCIQPFKGGPLKLGEDGNYWPSPANFVAVRPEHAKKKVLKLEPGDRLHIELTRGETKYVTDTKVATPQTLKTAVQLINIPE